MNWHDDALGRMKYLHAEDAVFDTVPLWRRHFFNDHALEGGVSGHLRLGPGESQGVEPSRIVRASRPPARP